MPRLFDPRFFHPRLFDLWRSRRRQRLLGVWFVLPAARQGFATLILAQLIFLHQEGRRSARRARLALGRALVAALAMPVAPAVAAAAAALLIVPHAGFARGLRLLRLRRLLLRRTLRLLLLRWAGRALLLIGASALAALLLAITLLL
jgi:hypothetical protein